MRSRIFMDTKDNAASVVSKPIVLRVLNGLLNGCEFVFNSERLLVVVGEGSSSTSLEPFSTLPDDTLFIPQDGESINFEIIRNKGDETELTLRELRGAESRVRPLSLNSRIQVGGIIFALREENKKWQPDVLGLHSEEPINRVTIAFTEKKRLALTFLIVISCIAIIALSYYWHNKKVDVNVIKLENALLANRDSVKILQGRDNITYIIAEDQRKAAWVNKTIDNSHYQGSFKVIVSEKEVERIYSWLKDYMPRLKYFRLQLNDGLTPKLLISKQRSNLDDEQKIEISTVLMNVIPYAKKIEIEEANDTDLINHAEEKLKMLGVNFKRSKANDYISYTVQGELSDSDLTRLQHVIDEFYHQWGREFIQFNISLENNDMKGKSFSYGEYNYIKPEPGQWFFNSEQRSKL